MLVGFGTRVGGGCTSGHGVCGVSRLSLASLVATATFIATGAATVAIAGRLLLRGTRHELAELGALAAGVLFGAGLVVSGMTDPRNVIGFLDFSCRWNPS